jgi:hypothetical protein
VTSINKEVNNEDLAVPAPAYGSILYLFVFLSNLLRAKGQIAIVNLDLINNIELSVELEKLSFPACHKEVFLIRSPFGCQNPTGQSSHL